jgi:two-component system LytT family response regulator
MRSTLRVIIVDDELLARQRLARLCGHIPDVEVTGVFEGATDAIEHLREADADVALLDIRMPGLTGIEMSELLPNGAPHIVFVTAHRAHAVDAFDVGAVDYVLKPVDGARLRRALDRARCALPSNTKDRRLPIHTHAGIVLVAPDAITHASFDGALVTIHTRDETHLTESSLTELASRLGGAAFERANRRCLLNMAHVDRLAPTPSGALEAVLTGGARIPISRAIGRSLRRRLSRTDQSTGSADRSA